MNDLSQKQGTETSHKRYFNGAIDIAILPARINADGRSIGHMAIAIDDPQKKSVDGSYPFKISISHAKIITKQSNLDSSFTLRNKSRGLAFMSSQNELRLNFIPEKNAVESDLWVSTPWGDVREKIKYATGLKHSLYETFECMIYAFIIAIVVRTFLFGAFFIPSQSMENTLYVGDRLVANKLLFFIRNPKRQEVVIFRTYSPKDRMERFHLEDSPHFDPTRNLREPDYYKSAQQLITAIVDLSFKDKVEIRNDALYVENMFIGFPEYIENGNDILIDGEFFAKGTLNSDTINLPDQMLGSLYIDGNHLILKEDIHRIELGKIDVYYPLGHSGLVQYRGLAPTNPLIDAVKGLFFRAIKRYPALIVGENQLVGNLVFKNNKWTIFGKELDLDLKGRAMRFPMPYQDIDGEKIEIGKLYIENGALTLKDGNSVLHTFGKPVLRDDIAIVNEQILGYVERSEDGFLINGLSLTNLWEIRDFIKRCVALPGDEITISYGKVSVNGQELDEPYLDEENMREDDYGPFVVPDGFYFMMGDNRRNSKDSRIIGPIPRQNIVGKAMFVFWPLNRVKSIPQ